MFCPNCGSADQSPNTYCRQCGMMLLDPSDKFYLVGGILGGNTPDKQINTNLFLSLGTSVASVLLLGFLLGFYDAHYERTLEPTPGIIYVVYVFLALIGFWQFIAFIVSLRLKSKFGQKNNTAPTPNVLTETTQEKAYTAPKTNPLLEPADMSNLVTPSVVEDTTKHLDKVPRG